MTAATLFQGFITMTATTFTLPRTGQRPLTFEGELLAEVDGSGGERDPSRWHTLAVYRTAGGSYVLAITLVTRWQGELDQHRVEHAKNPAAIEAELREYDPCPPGIGYPSRSSHAERQAQLEADLRRRYDALVTDLFERLGDDFAERID